MSVPDTTLSLPLAALPEARAAANPDAPAIADDTVQLDNAAFADRVARAAARLAGLGIGPGEVVAIALPNRLERAGRFLGAPLPGSSPLHGLRPERPGSAPPLPARRRATNNAACFA